MSCPPRLVIRRASSASSCRRTMASVSGWIARSSSSCSPPRRAALEDERRVEHVGAVVDPLLEALSAGLGERALQQLAVLDEDDLPAEVLEQAGHLHEQAVGHHRVEALAVVVDHPPAVLQPVLPVFEQRLVDIALVDLGIAHERDHAALGPVRAPALGVHVVLHEAGKTRARRRRGPPSPWRNRRRRYPWCARGRTARRRRRGSSAACRGPGCRADTGWRGTPGSRAASPPRGPRAAGRGNRAPSSA